MHNMRWLVSICLLVMEKKRNSNEAFIFLAIHMQLNTAYILPCLWIIFHILKEMYI